MIIHTDENNFQKLVSVKKLCLVDFYATWCGPCVMLGQELEAVAMQTKDFDIIKVDIDENPSLANEFGIDVVPTMYIFKNGRPVKQMQGYIRKAQIIKTMEELK